MSKKQTNKIIIKNSKDPLILILKKTKPNILYVQYQFPSSRNGKRPLYPQEIHSHPIYVIIEFILLRPHTLFLHEFTKKFSLLNRDFSLVHQYILIPVHINVYIFIKINDPIFFYILSNTKKRFIFM